MRRALAAAIDEFRVTRGRTLDMAAGVCDEQARKRLRTGTWSVAEVLNHLVRTEVAFRKYLRQALELAHAGSTDAGSTHAGSKGTIRIGFREVDTRPRPLPGSWMRLLTPVLFGLHAVTPFRFRLTVMRKPCRMFAPLIHCTDQTISRR